MSTGPGQGDAVGGESAPFVEQLADGVPDAVVDAVGKACEALEWIERARGHLYSFHQLMGRGDLLFGHAVDELRRAGLDAEADEMDRELVGRNVLDGRWTFQIVDEFDALYYEAASSLVRALERTHLGGRRHVYEARLKEQRRTRAVPGHEHRPPDAHDPRVETDRS